MTEQEETQPRSTTMQPEYAFILHLVTLDIYVITCESVRRAMFINQSKRCQATEMGYYTVQGSPGVQSQRETNLERVNEVPWSSPRR